ncbi:hypothetical protein [Streptomyces sp. MBT84]|uniref:hypothetical protein n=1 Tax=Streptomyces sp. MBT84 TaxID=1488414 RepID=UPI001C6EC588|nr:hypothetical protein [Streptomyces sp. MBT84]
MDTGVQGLCWDAAGSWSCSLTADVRSRFTCYSPKQPAGERFVNCTRNTVQRETEISTPGSGRADFSGGETPAGLRRPTRFTWTKEKSRSVTEIVPPDMEAWVEVETAQEHGSTTFTVTDGQGRAQT